MPERDVAGSRDEGPNWMMILIVLVTVLLVVGAGLGSGLVRVAFIAAISLVVVALVHHIRRSDSGLTSHFRKRLAQASKPPGQPIRQPIEPDFAEERADHLRSSGHRVDLRKTRATYDQLKDTGKLPSPPETLLKLVRHLRDPNWKLQDVAEIVKWDSVVTAKVLQWANSVESAPVEPITSLEDAIKRYGSLALQRAAWYVLRSRYASGECLNFDYTQFWTETVRRAAVAESITVWNGEGLRFDDAFTAALLCQIGRLSFATLEPERYSRVLADVDDNTDELLAREREVFGLDHNELAAHMMRDWGLPEFFWQGVHFQDTPSFPAPGSTEHALATTLATAGHMWHWSKDAPTPDIAELKCAVALAKELNVDIKKRYEDIDGQSRKVAALFEVPSPPLPPWPEDIL
jgi:HD-like signal output (HDOD) protein